MTIQMHSGNTKRNTAWCIDRCSPGSRRSIGKRSLPERRAWFRSSVSGELGGKSIYRISRRIGIEPVHSTDGTMYISYSYAQRERDSLSPPPSTFYTRQLLFPVLVTVYQMLECSEMNIVPISALATAEDSPSEWDSLLSRVDEAGWCVLTLDVLNIYGLAFEVTLSYNSKGMYPDS